MLHAGIGKDDAALGRDEELFAHGDFMHRVAKLVASASP